MSAGAETDLNCTCLTVLNWRQMNFFIDDHDLHLHCAYNIIPIFYKHCSSFVGVFPVWYVHNYHNCTALMA